MNWKQIIGKAAPWVLATIAAFFKEVLDQDITWWPTFSSVALGVIQFLLSRIKDKK
nr:MAG: hypothetical protein [Microvirus sp.]